MTDQTDQQEPKSFCSILGRFVGDPECKRCAPVPACQRNAHRLKLEAQFGDLPKAAAVGGEVLGRPEAPPVSATNPVAGEVEAAAEPEKERPKLMRRTDSHPESASPAAGLEGSDCTTSDGEPVQSVTPVADPAVASAEQPLADVLDHDSDPKDLRGSGPGDLPVLAEKKSTETPVGQKVRPRRRQALPSQSTVPPPSDAVGVPVTTGAGAAPEAPTPVPQGCVEEVADPPIPVTADTTGVDLDHPVQQDEGAQKAPCDPEDPAVPSPPGETPPKRKKQQRRVPGSHAADSGKASAKTGRCSPSNAGQREVKDKARRGDPAAPLGDTAAGAAALGPEHRVSSEDTHGRKCLGQRTVPLVDIRVGEVVTRKVNAAYVTQLTQVLKADRDLSPLVVDQDMNLVDGQHRLAALEKAGKADVHVVVYTYDNPSARLRHGAELNIGRGRDYSLKERKVLGQRMFVAGVPIGEIARIFSISQKAVETWTKATRHNEREDLRRKAVALRDKGKSQEKAAAALGISRDRVRGLLGGKRRSSQNPKEGPNGTPDTAPETERAADPTDMIYEAVRCVYLAMDRIKNVPQRAQQDLDRWRDAVEELDRGIDALTDEIRQAKLRTPGAGT